MPKNYRYFRQIIQLINLVVNRFPSSMKVDAVKYY